MSKLRFTDWIPPQLGEKIWDNRYGVIIIMIAYRTINSLPEFDIMAGPWNALLDVSASHVPFLRHEYLMAWWQTLGGGEWQEANLNILLGTEDDRLIGVAPLFLSNNRQGDSGLWFIGSIEVSDYLDILARPEDTGRFCDGLLKHLSESQPEIRRLDLCNILDDSPTLPAFEKAANLSGWMAKQEVLQHSPFILLPDDFETYLDSIDKKQRHEIRRKLRRLENSGVSHRWYITLDAEKLPADIDSFLDLMAFDEQKSIFLTPRMREHMQNVTRCAFQAECLQLFFLEIEGKKVAGSLSFDYLDRLWLYNSGINPAYSEYSPGWIMLAELIHWACEHHYAELDFMRGDEEYKYRFGARDRFVKRLLLTR
jgi:CelD/BcsL family acetyltransferase involved in cellulose biosynthesis